MGQSLARLMVRRTPQPKRVLMAREYINLLFIAPALLIFTLFVVYPMVSSLYYSLTNWDGIQTQWQFVGVHNFVALIRDQQFLSSVGVTLSFAFFITMLQNSFALILALCLNRFLRFSSLLRVVYLVPTLISSIAIGYVWSYIFSPTFGFLNPLLAHIGLTQLAMTDWLGDTHVALGCIVFVGCWQWVGFNMIIYLAALQFVPVEFYEAANIDGVNDWQRFRYITFPLIAPAFTINLVLIMIGGLRVFDIIFAMTQGGPAGTTEPMLLRVYKEAFSYSHFGYATAMSLVIFLGTLVLSVVTLQLLRTREVTY